MLLGDIPLKYVRCGIRFYNAHKTSLGTLFRSLEYGWYIEWDNGNKSVLMDLFDENHGELYYHLEICTVGDKIVIANRCNLADDKIYTHTYPEQ